MLAVPKPKREQEAAEKDTKSLQVPRELHGKISAFAELVGMSQREMTKRVYEWLMAQDEVVRAAVLRQIPKSVAPDVARIVLERMAGPRQPEIAFITGKAEPEPDPNLHEQRSRHGQGAAGAAHGGTKR